MTLCDIDNLLLSINIVLNHKVCFVLQKCLSSSEFTETKRQLVCCCVKLAKINFLNKYALQSILNIDITNFYSGFYTYITMICAYFLMSAHASDWRTNWQYQLTPIYVRTLFQFRVVDLIICFCDVNIYSLEQLVTHAFEN